MKRIIIVFSLLVFGGSIGFGQSWLWGAQGIGESEAYPTAVDSAGNVYIMGYFPGQMIFGTDTLTSQNVDVFCVKYDKLGSQLWAIQSKSPSPFSYAYGGAIATDLSGNEYLTGEYHDTVSFGAFTITSPVSLNFYLVKYDSSGNVKWARQSNGGYYSNVDGGSLATDIYNNVFAAGTFSDSVSFGAYNLFTGYFDAFLVKYDYLGNVVWAKQARGLGRSPDYLGAITTDRFENEYITGYFQDTVIFGNDTVNSNVGTYTTYLVKYDSTGSVIWANQAIVSNNSSTDQGFAITTDFSGYIYNGVFQRNNKIWYSYFKFIKG